METKHLLTLENFSSAQIRELLNNAAAFDNLLSQGSKFNQLNGALLANLFFEASTRTRLSFEVAAKKMSIDVININVQSSAMDKGESLIDTILTLEQMRCNFMVIRHPLSGTPTFLSQLPPIKASIINAGDGWHAHPSQALIDLFTIAKYYNNFADLFAKLTVAIIGDIAHSRVARSLIQGLKILGTRHINLIGPKTLMPANIEDLSDKIYTNLHAGLKDAQVIVPLRLQQERVADCPAVPSTKEYFQHFGLTLERIKIAHPQAIILHPGPIHRQTEIDAAVMQSPRCCILQQVKNSIPMRMAILQYLYTNINTINTLHTAKLAADLVTS